MTRRDRWTLRGSLVLLVVGVALLAAACGGGGKKAASTPATTGSNAGGNVVQKAFPDFRIVYDTGIDYLDPGLSYTVQGWQLMWNVYLSLLGYKHLSGPDGATLVPALATDMPQISS